MLRRLAALPGVGSFAASKRRVPGHLAARTASRSSPHFAAVRSLLTPSTARRRLEVQCPCLLLLLSADDADVLRDTLDEVRACTQASRWAASSGP